MANIVTRQVLLDGPRNVTVKLAGILDTSDVAATGATTSSTLAFGLPNGNVPFKAKRF